MKAETADYLPKARATLADAEQIAALPLPHVAAREACYAAYHAAEAYIFEQTGKAATTHRGVRSEFERLARREPSIDRVLTRFLATAYQFKAAPDYGIGPTVAPISADQSSGSHHHSAPLHRRHHSIAARLGAAARPTCAALMHRCQLTPIVDNESTWPTVTRIRRRSERVWGCSGEPCTRTGRLEIFDEELSCAVAFNYPRQDGFGVSLHLPTDSVKPAKLRGFSRRGAPQLDLPARGSKERSTSRVVS